MRGLHLLRAATIALACLACLSCSKQDADPRLQDGTIVISFWNGFTGPDGKTMEQIVRRFNETHQGRVRVKMQIIDWGTFYDKVTLGLAFGGAPDVFIIHANRVPEYAAHGSLENIDDFAATVDASDFVATAWTSGLWEGKRFGLPLDCHPLGMYYNTDLFRAAGIDKPPTTFDEFLETARKLKKDRDGDGDVDQWGFAFTDLHLTSTTFFQQFGGGLLSPDMQRSALNEPQTVAALQRMEDLYLKYKICPTPEGNDGWAGFRVGKVAMAFQGIWMINELDNQKELNYAAAPVPFFGPKKAVWAGGHVMVMPDRIEGDRRDAAWTFVKYLSDHSIEWAKGGQVPVRKSVLESPEFKRLKVQPQFAKQLPWATFEPFSTAVNQIAPFADSAVESVLNGGEDPKQALETAARRVNNVLRRQ
ncbi:MAG TPA: ABC transporter substrate-binding protein [Fimbriimonas sp.]